MNLKKSQAWLRSFAPTLHSSHGAGRAAATPLPRAAWAEAVPATRPAQTVAYIVSMFPCISETFILREIMELRRRGLDVIIFSLKPCSDSLHHPQAAQLVQDGRVRVASPWRGLPKFLGLLGRRPREVFALAAQFQQTFSGSLLSMLKSFLTLVLASDLLPMLRQANVGHIHAPWATYPSTAALFCARMAGYSFSFTARAHDLFLEDHGLALKFEEARFAQTITEYNRSLIERRFSGPRRNLHVIHSALDPSDFSARREPVQPSLILSIGRLVEMKGFTHLIDACALLRDQGLVFQCRIIGKGPLKSRLQAQIDRLQLGGHVQLFPQVRQDEVRRLLAVSTCFALPCITAGDGDQDGIPNVLMEAMAARVPVVSCPTSGVPELIQHGVTGLLARTQNPYSLAQQIKRLLLDPELAEHLSLAGRLKVEDEFDIRKNAARLAALFPTGT